MSTSSPKVDSPSLAGSTHGFVSGSWYVTPPGGVGYGVAAGGSSTKLVLDLSTADPEGTRQAAAKLREVESQLAATPDQAAEQQRKKAIIAAAIERARIKKEEMAARSKA